MRSVLCLLACAIIGTLVRGAPVFNSKLSHERSDFMAQLKAYEVISITSDTLHTLHPQSIASQGQQSNNPDAVRQFAKHVSFAFQSKKHLMRSMSTLKTGASASDESSTSAAAPNLFEYTITRSDDLFHPAYSQTRQIWTAEGVRRQDLEVVTPLSKIENCHYRGSVDGSKDRRLVMHTCFGGFSGMIKEGSQTWLIEPAHMHLSKDELQMHLQAAEQQRHTGMEDSSSTLPSEPLHDSHLHLLFRVEDVHTPPAVCSVGLSEKELEELRNTGNLPETAHVNSDHSHDDHDHAHDHSSSRHLSSIDDSTLTAYSTYLSAAAQKKEWLQSQGKSVAQAVLEGELPAEVEYEDEEREDHSFAHSSQGMHTMATTTSNKYVELLIANDKARYLSKLGQTETLAAAVVNYVKDQYELDARMKPGITVVLIGQVTFQDNDPWVVKRGVCSGCKANNGASVDELLKLWNTWRSNTVNVSPYIHDNAHLFSGIPFEQPTLGYAGVGAMCTNSISGGIETFGESDTTFYGSRIVAHEMGHNFGMNHDSTDNACPKSGFIMNAVLSSPDPKDFSECSVTYEKNWFTSTHATCLDNQPTKAYGDPICGNGFVEGKEECDPGSNPKKDPCCNATSCLFFPGVTCSGSAPCCENCQIVSADSGKVCREAANTCDLPETCPGPLIQTLPTDPDGSQCPTDLGYAAGTECTSGQYGPGLCFLNKCFSYLQQCRTQGANFQGAPFSTCPQQSELNQGEYCATLYCASDASGANPQSCTFFKQSNIIQVMSNGVPCPDGDGNLKYQCQDGACVNPEELNVNYYWNSTGFDYCEVCTEYQHQNISCLSKETNLPVAIGLCAPASKPEESQLCINPEKGCYGAQGRDQDIVDLFGYVTLSRKTLIFSTLGFIAAFLVVLGCCYQAVTFVGEHEELPGPSQDAELAKEQKQAGLTKSGGMTSSKKARSSGRTSSKKKKKLPPDAELK